VAAKERVKTWIAVAEKPEQDANQQDGGGGVLPALTATAVPGATAAKTEVQTAPSPDQNDKKRLVDETSCNIRAITRPEFFHTSFL
jgi:hypothetical protein